MKISRLFLLAGLFVALNLDREAAAAGLATQIADVVAGNARVDFVPRGSAAGYVLTLSGPGGVVERHEADSSRALFVTTAGPDGKTRQDGVYVFELRARRAASAAAPEELSGKETPDGRPVEVAASVRGRGEDPLPQTGTFWIQNGVIVSAGFAEPQAARAGRSAGRTPQAGRTALDVVTADDIIVQGSACIGLDCVNNETFGFHTIRLKENNTRIGFVDTSTSAGFPTNDWMIRANDSASGGDSYLGFVDQGATGGEGGADSGTLVFKVTAGAPASSLVVDSTGRVGLRTATPTLALHENTSDTPALRFEQNNSGGFTAQTWDIAGNEANFFVRDTTGGSRLPFRIRPGAPTSSIDISASGAVGVGTASPMGSLHVNDAASQMNLYMGQGNVARWRFVLNASDPNLYLWDQTAGAYRVTFASGSGYVGIGTTGPAYPLQMGSGAFVSAGGVWTNASSREYKENVRDLDTEVALETLAGLAPVTYAYKVSPGERHVGFIAEDVPDLVATPDRRGMSPMDVAAVLTKVVQEQQKTIRELSDRLARLEEKRP